MPHVKDDESTSAPSHLLWRAAEQGHHRAVLALMRHPLVDPNKVRSEDTTTPLYISAYHGHEEVVKGLLGHPWIDVNKGKSATGATPLLIAAEEGREGVVKALVGHPSIEVRRCDAKGTTPLSRSCEQGHEPVVELLVQHAGVCETDLRDAYHIAKEKGYDGIARLLSARCGSSSVSSSNVSEVTRSEPGSVSRDT